MKSKKKLFNFSITLSRLSLTLISKRQRLCIHQWECAVWSKYTSKHTWIFPNTNLLSDAWSEYMVWTNERIPNTFSVKMSVEHLLHEVFYRPRGKYFFKNVQKISIRFFGFRRVALDPSATFWWCLCSWRASWMVSIIMRKVITT